MIEAENLAKSFNNQVVLDHITFSVDRGDVAVFLGPSGCGKTTLLRILAGLIPPTAGTYTREGVCSMVFQEPRLLPWRTVEENLLLLNDISDRTVSTAQARSLLEVVELEDAAAYFPHQLSGGMKQRVAFARALAMDPDILLIDEPFGSLDYMTKQRLQEQFKDILEDRDITTVFATHDLESALDISDNLFVLGAVPCTIIDQRPTTDITDQAEVREMLAQQYPTA